MAYIDGLWIWGIGREGRLYKGLFEGGGMFWGWKGGGVGEWWRRELS